MLLQDYTDLFAVERRLQKALAGVELIADVEIAAADISLIAGCLRRYIANNGWQDATDKLGGLAPASIACLLVHQAIGGFEQNDFWKCIRELLGEELRNYQDRWGQIFERALSHFHLAPFSDDRPQRRYVRPILGHCGIPDYCLPDFFERLLVPVATGRIEFSDDIDELVTEWESQPSLFYATDKPVRDFFILGGKPARDFLSRCVEMARAAICHQCFDPAEFGLPQRVVDRFHGWLANHSSIAPSAVQPRFRKPELLLDLRARGLLLRVPAQRVPAYLLRNMPIIARASPDDRPPAAFALAKTHCDGVVETLPAEVPIIEPFDHLDVELTADDGCARPDKWSFQGLAESHPWMAFDAESQRCISLRPLTARRFWLVTPQDSDLSGCRVWEDAPLWHEHVARLVETDQSCVEVAFKRNSKLKLAIRVDLDAGNQPFLSGTRFEGWPQVQAEEQMFLDHPPELVLPAGAFDASSDRHRVSLATVGDDGACEIAAVPIKSAISQASGAVTDGSARICLANSSLAAGRSWGRFELRVRAKLGRDRVLHYCVVPAFSLECPSAQLIPDPNTGSKPVTMRLTFSQPVSIESIDETVTVLRETRNGSLLSHEILVAADAGKASLRLTIEDRHGPHSIPLVIEIPRMQWALYAAGGMRELRYQDKCLSALIDDVEQSPHSALYIRFDRRAVSHARLVLENKSRTISDGGLILLREWCDTIRAEATAASTLKLCVDLPDGSSQSLDVLRVEKVWTVTDVSAGVAATDNSRTLSIDWINRSNPRNCVLRIWKDSQLLGEQPILPGQSHAKFSIGEGARGDGRFMLEFAIADDWADATSPPDNYAPNVHELRIIGNQAQCLESRSAILDEFLARVASGQGIDLAHASPALADLAKPEIAVRFVDSIEARRGSTDDAPELLRALLSSPEVDRERLRQALARAATARRDTKTMGAVWLCNAFIALGGLQEVWDPDLRKLYELSARVSTGSNAPGAGTVALEQILAVYKQVGWKSPTYAACFLRALRRETGALTMSGRRIAGVKCPSSAAKNPLHVHWDGGKQELFARNWHQVRPAVKGKRKCEAAAYFLLATFERAIAWAALDCPEDVRREIVDLGQRAWAGSCQAYAKAIFIAEDHLEDWTKLQWEDNTHGA